MITQPGESAETALVEVAPGTALLFGQVPEGTDLVPFTLLSDDDQVAITTAIASSTSVLNVGAQALNGLMQAQGLVRLAPETLAQLQAGASAVQSGGYNLGTLAQNGEFVASVRWLPATGAQAASVVASLGSALAMIAIQIQLNELSSLMRENLALTETVLKTVRREQWAELTGLEGAVARALDEARTVGHVTPLLWDNISGYEADLRKQRDLFRRNVQGHAMELAKRTSHQERRQYLEKNGEAILLDAHSLLFAHKAWFQYQALRAGRAKLAAADDAQEAALLEAIVTHARTEHDAVVAETATLLGSLSREVWILAELPGKRSLPFTGANRSARTVGKMAEQILDVLDRLTDSVRIRPEPLTEPSTVLTDDRVQLMQDLAILRWHLQTDEALEAMASAYERGTGDILVALTSERVLIAKASDFRRMGTIARVVHTDEIRYVRLRESERGAVESARADDNAVVKAWDLLSPATRPVRRAVDRLANRESVAQLELITKDENFAWLFESLPPDAASVKALAALLADRMAIPEEERDALRAALPGSPSAPLQVTQ